MAVVKSSPVAICCAGGAVTSWHGKLSDLGCFHAFSFRPVHSKLPRAGSQSQGSKQDAQNIHAPLSDRGARSGRRCRAFRSRCRPLPPEMRTLLAVCKPISSIRSNYTEQMSNEQVANFAENEHVVAGLVHLNLADDPNDLPAESNLQYH